MRNFPCQVTAISCSRRDFIARSIGDYFSGGALRLGVTGLSRSGKTVFLTALVNNLIAGARLPVLAASVEGRIMRARLEPQPDDAVPRFAYEEHLASLSGAVSPLAAIDFAKMAQELRLTIEFESAAGWGEAKLEPQARPGRLSRRMAARPALARQELRRMVAARRWRRATPLPARRSRRNGGRRSSGSTHKLRRARMPRGGSLNCLPPTSSGRATTSMRFRPCRPAGS